jgi:hypothetical protein
MESQEDVWAHLDDLLCISWGSLEDQIDCPYRQLDNLDGSLNNFATMTSKVNANKFDILRTLPEYLEVLTSNRPQSNKA